MLTRLTIRNFKRFDEVDIELGNPVVFIGPNNSGKTSALQALALWSIGLNKWNGKRSGKSAPEKRPGVTINRRDLLALPVPGAKLLWRELHVRNVQNVNGRQATNNIRIELVVKGIRQNKAWRCGLEFDYANEESFYCRPLRLDKDKRMPVPDEATGTQIVFLPPMSGLATTETRLDEGAVNVRVGEGRTAEVLRNLCWRVREEHPDLWERTVKDIENLFGSRLESPDYVQERGEIVMGYREHDVLLDLSCSGRGLQQTLLVLTYMRANPGAVVLLDEPDAHLEILRQREIYKLIADVAAERGNQIIAASHSEVLLNEAAGKDTVIAFVGKPHVLGSGRSQVQKALKDIGFDQYYQAEQAGWVLYLEGSTDLAVLQAFAKRLGNERAMHALERPFVRYVANQPGQAAHHYYALKEALPDLQGLALFDRLETEPKEYGALQCISWKKREIENYLCTRKTLEAYARASSPGTDLFTSAEADRRVEAMREAIAEIENALTTLGKGSPWTPDAKVSDDFLTPLLEAYFRKLDLPNIMAKKQFHELAAHVPENEIDPEIGEKLESIANMAEGTRGVT